MELHDMPLFRGDVAALGKAKETGKRTLVVSGRASVLGGDQIEVAWQRAPQVGTRQLRRRCAVHAPGRDARVWRQALTAARLTEVVRRARLPGTTASMPTWEGARRRDVNVDRLRTATRPLGRGSGRPPTPLPLPLPHPRAPRRGPSCPHTQDDTPVASPTLQQADRRLRVGWRR